jgi:serine/threonine-protein kinase
MIGDIIAGKYRIERVLGAGGMGMVVAAKHLRLGEQVAIKFPLARLEEHRDVVERLEREGRAAMRIRSEHVAKVYDVGTLPTGQPYLVMEYLVGRDLGAVVAKRGPLPLEEAVEYVLQAIEALAEAHAHGIIHRDLKPSNLFLSRRADQSPFVKVIDFGISKLTTTETTLTGSFGAIGSPAYMAPEQMRSTRSIDVRCDIWGLGATLYALVTGVPPFRGASIVEIHESILEGPPLLRAKCPDAPTAVEAILIRCMQKAPADRYADVGELATALAEFAPEHARVSAIRANRTLRAAAEGALLPIPVAGHESAPPSPITTEPLPPATAPPREASWHENREGLRQGGAPLDEVSATSPSASPAQPAKRRKILGGLAALAAGVGLTLLGSKHAVRAVDQATPDPTGQPSSGRSELAVVASQEAAPSSRPVPAETTSSTTGRAPPAASVVRPPPAGAWNHPSPHVRSTPSESSSSRRNPVPAPAHPEHARDPLADPD